MLLAGYMIKKNQRKAAKLSSDFCENQELVLSHSPRAFLCIISTWV
jgi:hypothetical protein